MTYVDFIKDPIRNEMRKAINWEFEVPDELNEIFERNILRAHWRHLTNCTIYCFWAEYNNKKVTFTWTGEGFNSGLIWAWGKFSGDEILKDLILKKYRFNYSGPVVEWLKAERALRTFDFGACLN